MGIIHSLLLLIISRKTSDANMKAQRAQQNEDDEYEHGQQRVVPVGDFVAPKAIIPDVNQTAHS